MFDLPRVRSTTELLRRIKSLVHSDGARRKKKYGICSDVLLLDIPWENGGITLVEPHKVVCRISRVNV